MPTVTVSGLDASWSSTFSGTQTGKANGWLGMPGTGLNDQSTEYLKKMISTMIVVVTHSRLK